MCTERAQRRRPVLGAARCTSSPGLRVLARPLADSNLSQIQTNACSGEASANLLSRRRPHDPLPSPIQGRCCRRRQGQHATPPEPHIPSPSHSQRYNCFQLINLLFLPCIPRDDGRVPDTGDSSRRQSNGDGIDDVCPPHASASRDGYLLSAHAPLSNPIDHATRPADAIVVSYATLRAIPSSHQPRCFWLVRYAAVGVRA